MPLIRVREKHQVTLPRDVIQSLHITAPSHMEYKIVPEGVLIRPLQKTQPESKLAKLRRLRHSVPGAYGSVPEADAHISHARREWDRRIDQPGSDSHMRGTRPLPMIIRSRER